MATARFSPRFFDQRLDERFDLFALERFAFATSPERRVVAVSVEQLVSRTRTGGRPSSHS
jgi:hypothetical protein